MDRRGAFDLLIGSVAKDGETLAKCASSSSSTAFR